MGLRRQLRQPVKNQRRLPLYGRVGAALPEQPGHFVADIEPCPARDENERWRGAEIAHGLPLPEKSAGLCGGSACGDGLDCMVREQRGLTLRQWKIGRACDQRGAHQNNAGQNQPAMKSADCRAVG